MTFIELILLGIFVGAVTGVTGASGVLVLVPILSTFFNVPLDIILGTSLFVDVIASISVSFAYARAKNVEVRSTLWILIGSLLGAQIGSFFAISVSKVLIMLVLLFVMNRKIRTSLKPPALPTTFPPIPPAIPPLPVETMR